MTLYGYSYYNRKVGSYAQPQFEVYDKQLKIEMVKRAYIYAKDKDREAMDECDFYYLGIFNDVTGEFELTKKPEFLLSFGGNKDGKED